MLDIAVVQKTPITQSSHKFELLVLLKNSMIIPRQLTLVSIPHRVNRTIPPNIEIFKTSRLGATNSEYQRARVKESNTGLVRSEETKQLIRQNRAGVCTGSDNGAWNGGTSYFPYCPKFNEPRKRAVRNFFDNKCLTCGKPASENYRGQKVIALSVHHIHHNKTEGCHGIPFNLVPLCFDCHNEEQFKQEEYKTKINQILDGGFASGRWSRVAYEREVMYPE